MAQAPLPEEPHATKRARERFGIHLDHRGLNDLGNQIRQGHAEYLGHESEDHRSHWLCHLPNHTPVRAVYDRETKNIVTILPVMFPVSTVVNWRSDKKP